MEKQILSVESVQNHFELINHIIVNKFTQTEVIGWNRQKITTKELVTTKH